MFEVNIRSLAYQRFDNGVVEVRADLLDALIGHIAVGLNEELATFNVKHYSAVAGLRTIQPY